MHPLRSSSKQITFFFHLALVEISVGEREPPGTSHRAKACVTSCWIASLRSPCEHQSCCKPNRRFLLWWVGNHLRELVTGAGAHRPEGANRGSPTGSTSPANHLPLTSSLLLPNSI